MLNVRDLQEKDIPLITSYWFDNSPDYLKNLGVDVAKMPTREQFSAMLTSQLVLPYNKKKSYALIWEHKGKPIGHTNVNPVEYGSEAFMHIHIWAPEYRKKGFGLELIKKSLPLFFKKLELQKLNCEPYALNPAPNRTLEKLGFTFIKEYITTPGSITFEQPVKRWEISRNKIFNV